MLIAKIIKHSRILEETLKPKKIIIESTMKKSNLKISF